MYKYLAVGAMVLFSTNTIAQKIDPVNDKIMLLRCDDIGMCHAVNMAFEKVAQTGFPVSASVMFACPWYQEAVDMLKKYDNVSVGIHLTLNAEWRNYRWGPVLGREAVPSLVDSNGYFFPSRAKLFGNNPHTAEIERELRAQLDRAVNSGLKIDYIDHHMSAAVQTLELRELLESLAREYGMGISGYFGEKYSNATYFASFEDKTDSLAIAVKNTAPGLNLQVFHVGLDTPELRAMLDLNPFGLPEMSKQRQGELNSILSSEFRDVVKKHNVTLTNYSRIISQIGLKAMRRPSDIEY